MSRGASLLLQNDIARACAVAWAVIAAMACYGAARADELEADGKWHGNASLSTSYAAGNTRSSSLALSTDAARRSDNSKLLFYAQALGSRAQTTASGGSAISTTANQWKGGTRYDRDMDETQFGFVALDLTHDSAQLLSLRSVASVGAGYHLIRAKESKWDLLGGVAYRDDRYNYPGVVVGSSLRTRFDTAQLLIGEESDSKLTPTTTLSQRLMVTPNLGATGGALVTFDGSLMVAISDALSLKITVQDRYNSLSQAPIKKNDFLLLTGLNVKFGG